MTATVQTAMAHGLRGLPITVECDTSNSLPNIVIVGLGNKAIDESKERVRSALKNSQLDIPRKRITINLAPADVPKENAVFDLPIALAILLKSEQIKPISLEKTLVLGELSLNGDIRPIRGVIGITLMAIEMGVTTIIAPIENAPQIALVSDVTIIAASSLKQLYEHLTGLVPLQPFRGDLSVLSVPHDYEFDFSDIVGQELAKRALEIAAAGRHNVMMDGPPGTGKTLLAKALPSILPAMSRQEIIEVTHLQSLAGHQLSSVVTVRPLRAPHHSSSHVALVGGGKNPRPGEISLSHRGVLFLDELPEFPRQVIESLRQPLEDRQISSARASDAVVYPADFILVATRNPCPCGYLGDTKHECTCTTTQILQYNKKLSGPIMDRIDMHVLVDRVDMSSILDNVQTEPSSAIRKRVEKATHKQQERFQDSTRRNSSLSNREIKTIAKLDHQARAFLDQAAERLGLSTRAYIRTIRLARTIADLNENDVINQSDIAEALQFRQRTQSF